MRNRVGVLGTIEVTAPDRTPVDIGGKRQRRLLAALALRADEVVSVDSLVDVVFDGNPTEAAERTLQSYVSRLRRAIDGERDGDDTAIERTGPGYVLRLDGDLDATRFEALTIEARSLADDGDHAGAVRRFDEALRLWRGRPFAEFADEHWALAESERLNEIRGAVIEDRAESQLALGGHAEVIPDLERFSRDEATRERPRAQLMLALYRSGRQADALRVYQDYFSYLADEVGLAPSNALRDLETKIITGDPSLDLTRLGGEKLRGYQLYEELGRGAFSVVHRGTQPSVGRDVAVKVIRSELANDPDFVRRFETEARMVANLEHPHIVPLYDFWREPDNAYLVMRWLRGGTLRDRLAAGPLSVDEAARLVSQVGGALEAAHRRGIVHRDIKPANVFCDDEGNFYLGDFGIAIGAATSDEPIAERSIAPAYAAPELLDHRPVSAATDIYGLAVTTFEALAGRAPFADAASDAELIQRQRHEPLPLLSTVTDRVTVSIDAVIQRATAKAATGRYGSVREFVAAFTLAAAGGTSTRPIAPTLEALDPGPNPYKGLRAFHEADAGDFFGRSTAVAELLDVLRRRDEAGRLLTVVGPSGSGKSSVVRAGLIPALREGAIDGSEDWFVATMLPGASPFAELEAALLRIAVNPPGSLMEQLTSGPDGVSRALKRILPDDRSELVLVLDQFEELFTLTTVDEKREDFLAGVLRAIDDAHSRLRVVATLRADFYDRPLQDPSVATAIKLSTVALTPLASDELAEAIEQPARAAGGSFEDGLVARIAADVVDQPGSLPLLQYTLAELYDHTGGRLTHDAYDGLGGVAGALAGRAEAIYTELSDEAKEGTHLLFTRLVTLGEDSEDTRRRVLRSELDSSAAITTAIDAYEPSRLLTFDRDTHTREPTVEVAHETLIRDWPRLRAWIDDDRDGLRIHRHLTTAALAWNAKSEDHAELYRGSRLAGALNWAASHEGELNDLERRYLAASRERRDLESARALHQTRRLRRSLLAVAAVAVVALVAGSLAIREQRRAEDAQTALELQNSIAEETNRLLRVERLRDAAAAAADRTLAILLALEAHALAAEGDPLGLDALAHALLAVPEDLGSLPAGSLTALPALDSFLTTEPGFAVVRPMDAPHDEVLRIAIEDGRQESKYRPAAAPDGRRVALGTRDGIRVLDSLSGDLGDAVMPLATPAGFPSVTWTSDRQLLLNSDPIEVYSVDNLAIERSAVVEFDRESNTLGSPGPGTIVRADPDRGRLAVHHRSGQIEIWDTSQMATSGRVLATHDIPDTSSLLPRWTGDGDLLVGTVLPGNGTPDSRFWVIPGEDLTNRLTIDADIMVWNIQEVGFGRLFVSGYELAAVTDRNGAVVAGPWKLDPAHTATAAVELGEGRLAISTVATEPPFLPGPTRLTQEGGSSPMRTRIPGLSVADGNIVQYLPDSGIATVASAVSGEPRAALHHAIHVEEIWDVHASIPTRLVYDHAGEFDHVRVSETDDGPVAIGLADPTQPGSGALRCAHCVTGGEVSVIDLFSGTTIAQVAVDPGQSISGLYVSSDRRELTVFGNGGVLVVDLVDDVRRSIDIRGTALWLVRNEEVGRGYVSAGGRMVVYDLATLAVLEEIASAGPRFDGRILPDASGERVVVGGSRDLLVARLPDLTEQTIIDNPDGLAGRLDPSGQVVIGWGSAPSDGVQLWHAETGQALGPFIRGPVGDQHIGGTVAQVIESAVYVWEVDPATWRSEACNLAGRRLTEIEWRTYVSDTEPYDPVDCTSA